MAVIGKIRKQSGLLMILIGGALALFILGDLLNSNSRLLGGTSNDIGEINGSKISYNEFQNNVQRFIANRFGGRSMDESTRMQVREQVWNQMIRERVLLPEYDKLGLSVSNDELFYVIKNDPNNPNLVSYFTDPQSRQVFPQFSNGQGGLNSQAVIDYLNQILNVASEDQEGVLDARNAWAQLEAGMKEDILDNKYNNLLVKGLYVTQLEADIDALERADRVTFSYVSKDYSTIEDSEVSYDESDLKAYYNAHKDDAQFKQDEPVRAVEFIVFDVKPTEEDITNVFNTLADIKPSFETSVDDTMFVRDNAVTPNNIRWVKAGSFPAMVDSTIMSANDGEIVGPFRNGNKFELVKVNAHKATADSINARHILIRIDSLGPEIAEAKADSIFNVIKKKKNFAEMAEQFSEDPGSKAEGGDLGWFVEGRMVPEFNDACVEGKVGDMPIVKTQFGYHIIEIMDKTEPREKALVAVIDLDIEASQATYQQTYARATNFVNDNSTPDNFTSGGEELGLKTAPSVRKNDPSMMGMEDSRKIVKWAFESEVGDISLTPFDLQESYVVAMVKESREKGVVPFDVAKDQITKAVIDEKKAEKIIADINNQTDLNSIASTLGTAVQIANDVTFSSFSINGIGNEQELMGMAFSLDQGKTSVPVKGKRGVYVIRIDNVVNPDVANLRPSKIQLESSIAGNSRFASFAALKEKADITDNRSNFY